MTIKNTTRMPWDVLGLWGLWPKSQAQPDFEEVRGRWLTITIM